MFVENQCPHPRHWKSREDRKQTLEWTSIIEENFIEEGSIQRVDLHIIREEDDSY